jgi:hypothetical protein
MPPDYGHFNRLDFTLGRFLKCHKLKSNIHHTRCICFVSSFVLLDGGINKHEDFDSVNDRARGATVMGGRYHFE